MKLAPVPVVAAPSPLRPLAWLCGGALAASAVWYAVTVQYSVRHPLNGGAERTWAFAWLGFLLAVALTLMARRWTRVLAFWLGAAGAIALAMPAMSGRLGAVLVVAWLLALGWIWAERLLRLLGAHCDDALERASLALPLGLVLLSFLGLAFGLTYTLHRPVILLVLGALTVLDVRALAGLLRAAASAWSSPALERHGRQGAFLLAAMAFLLLLNLAWALAPEVQYDALNYQLAVPRSYVASHGIVDLPIYFHSYFAHLFNVLFALGMALQGMTAAKLLVCVSGCLAALCVYVLGRALLGERLALLVAALFYSTPLVCWLSGTAFVDLGSTLFLTSALLALLRWKNDPRWGWLAAGGLLAGAAFGTKLTAICGLVPLGIFLLVLVLRAREVPVTVRLRWLLLFTAAFAVAALPWYAIVYAFTGNPFFPMYNAVFKSPRWPAVNTNFNAGSFGMGRSFLSLLRLPFALTFRTEVFGEALLPGALGLAPALLPVSLILARRRTPLWSYALALGFFVVWVTVTQYARYFVPVLPLLCVAAVALVPVDDQRAGRFAQGILVLVVALQGAMLAALYWHVPQRIPLRVAFGAETDEAFLKRTLTSSYPAAAYLNRVLSPGQRVVGVGVDEARLYLDAPLASMTETVSLAPLVNGLPDSEVAANLLRAGYTHVVLRGGKEETFPFATRTFLKGQATLELQAGSIRVYRLRDARRPEPAPPVPVNLLQNPGFEIVDKAGVPSSWAPFGRPRVADDPALSYGGRRSVRSEGLAFLSQPVRVRAGATYTMGRFARADEPGQNARLQVNWLDERGGMVGVTIQAVPVGASWAWQKVVATAPAKAVTAVVFASVHDHCTVWFDDFWFSAGSADPHPEGK